MTEQWRKKAEIYKIFGEPEINMWTGKPFHKRPDFSEKAAQKMYEYETYGKGELKSTIFGVPDNGYFIGKKLMNITLAMWKEDIENGLLAKFELYEDETLPNWWLDEVLKGMFMSPQGEKNRMELLNV